MVFEKLRNGLMALVLAGAVSGSVNAQAQERGTRIELEYLLLKPIQTQFQNNKEMEFRKVSLNPFEKPFDKATDEKTDWVYHGLEASYIALNVADYFLTYRALDKKSDKWQVQEVHPIMKNFIHNKALTALIKTGATGFVLYANRKLKKENSTAAYALLTAMNLIYAGIVYNNYQVNVKLDLK